MSQILKEFYDEKYGPIDFESEPLKMVNCEEIATICGNNGLAVTARHIHSVIKGHQKPKHNLERTVQIAGARIIDGQSEIQARAREIRCLTVNGVQPGSVIIGHTKYCRWCHIPFVGAWNRLYCCNEHGVLFRRAARRMK